MNGHTKITKKELMDALRYAKIRIREAERAIRANDWETAPDELYEAEALLSGVRCDIRDTVNGWL